MWELKLCITKIRSFSTYRAYILESLTISLGFCKEYNWMFLARSNSTFRFATNKIYLVKEKINPLLRQFDIYSTCPRILQMFLTTRTTKSELGYNLHIKRKKQWSFPQMFSLNSANSVTKNVELKGLLYSNLLSLCQEDTGNRKPFELSLIHLSAIYQIPWIYWIQWKISFLQEKLQ